MTLDQYIEWTETTDFMRNEQLDQRLQYYTLGLTSEAGEVADLVAKMMRPDNGSRFAGNEMKAELGDVLYYIARICAAAGWTFEELARSNQVKLAARHATIKHAVAMQRLGPDGPLTVCSGCGYVYDIKRSCGSCSNGADFGSCE